MQAFFEQVVEQKCEGLMVKLLESGEGITGEDDDEDDEVVSVDGKKGKSKGGKKKPLPATYEPDQRSQGWLKVKKGVSSSTLDRSHGRLPGRTGRLSRPRPDRGVVGIRSQGWVVESDPPCVA